MTTKKKKGYGLEIKTFHGKRRCMKRCVILNPKAGSVKDLDAVKKQLRRLEASSFHLTKNKELQKHSRAKRYAITAMKSLPLAATAH
jgi:hypothetical protein